MTFGCELLDLWFAGPSQPPPLPKLCAKQREEEEAPCTTPKQKRETEIDRDRASPAKRTKAEQAEIYREQAMEAQRRQVLRDLEMHRREGEENERERCREAKERLHMGVVWAGLVGQLLATHAIGNSYLCIESKSKMSNQLTGLT